MRRANLPPLFSPAPAPLLYGDHMSLTCSAKGCQAEASWSLLWNNPKLHTPDRRKTWLACDEHRESLAEFLGARQFLRDVVPVTGDTDAEDTRGTGDTGGRSAR
jgi:hypothetical protein